MTQAQNSIKMMVNFNRGLFIPLIGDKADPVKLHHYLKDKNARIGLETVRGMLDGTEIAFKDFQVATLESAKGIYIPDVPPAKPQLAPMALRAPVPTGPQPAKQASVAHVAKGRGREYEASGVVKPLKRGTVYAKMMEMMLNGGATMKELLASTTNATAGGVNDVLSWQIKNRGYGLRFEAETGKYHLVLPKGHKELTYKD